jgi:hypothetical protein
VPRTGHARGNYDASNNTRSVSLRVEEMASGFTFSAGASDNTQTFSARIVSKHRAECPDGTSYEDTWSYNYEINEPRTQPVFGSNYTIHVEVESDDWAYVQDPVVPLAPYRQPLPDHTNCAGTANDAGTRFSWCYSRTNDVVEGIDGWVEGVGTVRMVQGC